MVFVLGFASGVMAMFAFGFIVARYVFSVTDDDVGECDCDRRKP